MILVEFVKDGKRATVGEFSLYSLEKDLFGLRPYKVREVDNGSLELFAAEYRFSKRHRPSA